MLEITSIEQMANDSEQIVGAVNRIDDLSKKAAGQAQTVSAATEEQSVKLAMELGEAVNKFEA